MENNKETIEAIERIIANVLAEKMRENPQFQCQEERENAGGVIKIDVPGTQVSDCDRMDTGKSGDQVYTHDLFSLSESPRLGCGIMEMENTTFNWILNYDEIDYVIDGTLTIITDRGSVSAGPGELILIPQDSKIQFSVTGKARFLYVTYPANWAEQ